MGTKKQPAFLCRKGIKLKSGELVNKSNNFSEDLHWFLYKAATDLLKVSNNSNIEVDDLVNEAWLKHSRYFSYIQPQGTKMVMCKYLLKNKQDALQLSDYDFDITEDKEEISDGFEDLFAYILTKVSDITTKFMIELYFRHGLSYRKIATYFNITGQSAERRIKNELRKLRHLL